MEDSADHTYSDNSPFVRLLETKGRVRILDTFISKPHVELSAEDIHDISGVSESTFARNKDVLIELDIITHTKEVGQKKYYKLNTDNPIVTDIAEFHTNLVDYIDHINNSTNLSREQYIGEIVTTRAKRESSDTVNTEITTQMIEEAQ